MSDFRLAMSRLQADTLAKRIAAAKRNDPKAHALAVVLSDFLNPPEPDPDQEPADDDDKD